MVWHRNGHGGLMPMVETAAALAIFNVLDVGTNYSGAQPAQIAQAKAQLQVLANAFAKCIPHLQTGIANTNDTGAVTGAVTGPTPTPGAFSGTGSGQVVGLLQGDALTGVGLAGLIMTVLHAGTNYLPGADIARARQQLALLANSVAHFATYVMANAQVITTVVGPAITPGANGPSTGTGTGTVA